MEVKTMRDIIKELNKHSLAQATGISYSKLRKYASGEIRNLTKEERQKVKEYLIKLANQIII